MLNNSELKEFQKNFKELYQKALNHLINIEWVDQIDRDVKINVPIISENSVHFELVHTMIGRLLATKEMTWEEINGLVE